MLIATAHASFIWMAKCSIFRWQAATYSVFVGELYSVSCTLFGWRALALVDLFVVVVVAEHEDMARGGFRARAARAAARGVAQNLQ